jgi:TRAP-type C4-dicarboxylate transport system permease large subunit
MITLLDLGINHPAVGTTLFVGYVTSRVRTEEVMKQIWPLYGVIFVALMLAIYIPAISLWLPHPLKF